MYLNDYLLQFPGAKVAATFGVEWYSKYTPVISCTKKLSSKAHASYQTQVDEVANSISNLIKNVLSENEVRLNESGMFHVLRPQHVLKLAKVSYISIHFHRPPSSHPILLQIC